MTAITSKPSRLALGLMSGTSADGVDAVLVEISGSGLQTRIRHRHHLHRAYPSELRQEILTAAERKAPELASLDRRVGLFHAETACQATLAAEEKLENLDVIGSHGQTIFHHSGQGSRVSVQIGDGDWIAEATGALVVSDFRRRDLAAGGEGAPVSSYPDFLMFAAVPKPAAILNLGGIANLTLLFPDLERLVGFDSGPGNMILDGLSGHFSGGRERMDRDGQGASKGRVLPGLLQWMLEHPFLRQPIPKSTGREAFGAAFQEELLRRHPGGIPSDYLATAVRFTARTVAASLEPFRETGLTEVVAGGGGVRNPVLMQAIQEEIGSLPLTTTGKYGVGPLAREATAFAVLANETLFGRPGNHPGATGARRGVILGKISS